MLCYDREKEEDDADSESDEEPNGSAANSAPETKDQRYGGKRQQRPSKAVRRSPREAPHEGDEAESLILDVNRMPRRPAM